MEPIIRLENVTKTYRGVPAVKNVSFDLRKGEIHALLGENGAGKSTLTKIIAGVVDATSGKMFHKGVETAYASPHAALEAGIAMVFQETSLVPSMTVAQNLYLGTEKFLNRLRGTYISAQQFLQSLNFPVDPNAMVATLGAAKRQMVEIARAVHHNAEIIIFDEPTATLTPEEKRHFFALIRRLKARGVSIVFISHALEEALMIADRITILRDGELVITDDTSAFDRDRIVAAMVGRSLTGQIYRQRDETKLRKAGKKVLSVQDISMSNIVRNNSFSIFEGQITGVFGLIGSGRTETFKIVSGIYKRDFLRGGAIELDDRPVRYLVPSEAVADGIVYVTEDRKSEGIFETMGIAENLFGGLLAAGREKAWVINQQEMRQLSAEWTKTLNIKAINDNARVVELSGGNQQKVVIGKGLVQQPRIVIFDEPTRGVDVGAIAEIHQIINRLADEGLAVVVISSYLPEIINLSDRILVCRQGRIVEEFSPAEATEEKIMYAAVH
ncbi:ATP-binding cassette domain-containing protein [Mesorhizobium sp. M2A.F.Ca.ET.037.01.1.1]|uniref:sugar ABC transporter ATP-binding protein n=1 Tax=unclassified Mesorhizobium TaxID=325217 RepID=UPI000F75B4BE|nr:MULTISPECIES: sugar ABC transporter ATP-binding protein [unclassified Mesorhizobium]RVC67385.1 ATP-binding cassette domain-containing protein [Mesorhizobium sp. M00.F.Ca.ET.038.03.1.1]AZO37476.1 sugar ABC transporter ATP-binding protein [Mesorhizobium sp. M2A.F.Ca.ET.046.03.2.1]RUX11708.1 ATP-binding cassette domain-containing protein [Mesorhizobium sp. M2A.F.Ca.ET.037.01.1.1]RWA91158.1 MAG: ATP-binding cassette domain-containing protein [Mesorhizobium sp.]RWB46951.1 MAG: ATP-binding casset